MDTPPATAASIDALFARWNTPDSPGCSLGVSQDGVTVYQHGYGMANLDLRVPITPDSVFHVASVSKQFTAMSILLLAGQRRISLDDEARKYVTELPDYGSPLTIRHLLTHTSGLRDAFLLMGLGTPREDNADPNDAIVQALARQQKLNFVPGTDFRYNNGGYTLLGVIVRRLTGQSLGAFADANIFKPLGMMHTHFHDDPTMIVPNRASAYHRVGETFHRAVRGDPGGVVGNAGLFTTSGDLLRWEQNFAAPRIGDEALISAMQTPAVLTTGEKTPYGFGLFIGEHHGLKTIEHGGGDAGVGAYVLRYPERGLAVALLCNADNIDAGGLAKRVADIYLPAADTAKGAPTTTPAAETATKVPREEQMLPARAGIYRAKSSETFIHLILHSDTLVGVGNAGTDQGDSFPLTPVSGNRFIIPGTEIAFEFLPTAFGQPKELRVIGEGPKPVTMRQIRENFTPSPTQLRAFAGTYSSRELDTTYRLTVRKSALTMLMPGRPDVTLEPIFPDAFYGPVVDVVEFTRDAHGAITGFTVNAGGAWGLRFDRVKR